VKVVQFMTLTGVGLGFLYLPSEVGVNYWFEKHRVIAAGLAGCGAGIGNLVLPPVLDFLIEEFGWRNTCIFLSGLGKYKTATTRKHAKDKMN